MFNALPQKLSSPFGLLGDNAKLTFRTSPGGIRRLAEPKLIAATDSYWDQYTTLFDSPSDVFSLISSSDIRRALIDSPANVATLINVLCTRLFNLVSDHTFPTATSSSQFVPSFATSLLKSSAGSTSRDTTKEVLNCLRVLQRVLPVIFEAEWAEFEQAVLWKKGLAAQQHEVVDEQAQPQFVIEDDDGDEEEGERPSARTAQNSGEGEDPKPKALPSLAERLTTCAIDLLFCCGFTLPTGIQVDHYKINYVIWEKGVGSTIDPGTNHAHDIHKVEVLRLLLVLFSKQIYVPPTSLLTAPSAYSLYFVQSTPRRHVLAILCSLLNTVMNNVTSPTGTMVGGVAAALPYNHLVFKGEDVRATLVGSCLQVVCALFDFQSGSARDVATGTEASSAAPTMKTNAFRYFAAKLHRAADFTFILDGVIGRLAQCTAYMSNMLPGSSKPVPHVPETVLFFWKMMDLNKKFRTYVVESDKVAELVVHLLCYCLDAKDKPEQHGLCRAISYILQTLFAERQFCEKKLLKPFTVSVPSKWSSQGTIADFVVASIYAIVATSSGGLSSLHPTLIIVLTNAAPYLRHLSVVSSSKLLSLFMSFSNPAFLLADEGHPRLLFFLLEAFNIIIYSHPRDNPNLLYAIVRSHKNFEDLNYFTLARGLRQIRQMQQAKEDEERRRERGEGGKRGSVDRTRSPNQEKSSLLAYEGRRSLNEDEPHYAPNLDEAEQALATTQPLMSPTSVTSPPHHTQPSNSGDAENEPVGDEAPSSLSEKARGKRREQGHDRMTSSLEHVAATGVGRNGFVPTEDWVESWHQRLPLDPILLAIAELLPRITEMQTNVPKSKLTGTIIDYLRAIDLEKVLPPQEEIVARKFKWSDASLVWMTSLIWGEIFVRGTTPLGLWNATNVRLFYVKHAQAQTRQISEAVSTVVGGIGGLLGRNANQAEGQNVRSRSGR